jgi:hypothetical protein
MLAQLESQALTGSVLKGGTRTMQTRPMEAASAVPVPGAYVDGGRQATIAALQFAGSIEEGASLCHNH